MNEQEQRAAILDFERNRQLLAGLSAQKQQSSVQVELTKSALEELSKTKEKTVYKIIGNVLFPKDAEEMEKELKDRKDSLELRLKTIEKQEDTLLKKLKSIQTKLESEMKGEPSAVSGASEAKIEKKKK